MSCRVGEAYVVASKPKTTSPRPTPKRFYAKALSEAERADLPVAFEIEGIEEELALLRVRLRQAIAERPDDLPLMFRGIELIARAVATRYRLSKRAEQDLSSNIAGVVRSLGDLWPREFTDE